MTEIRTDDPYRIVPRGAMAATVRPLDLQIRTMVEYDVNFMQDRVRADLFAGGHPAGVYAIAAVPRDENMHPQEAIRTFEPELGRMIVDQMLGHRRHQALVAEVRALRDYIERDRWWQFMPVRRWASNARLVVRSWLKPQRDLYHLDR